MKKPTTAAALVTKVELSNRPGVFATFDAADWTAWLASGRSTVLFAAGNGHGLEYVLYYDPAHPHAGARVARTLVNPGPRKVIKYANGDRTDLRRANLFVTAGKTRRAVGIADRLATLRGPLLNWR